MVLVLYISSNYTIRINAVINSNAVIIKALFRTHTFNILDSNKTFSFIDMLMLQTRNLMNSDSLKRCCTLFFGKPFKSLLW